MQKFRLDVLLLERHLVESRSQAQRLVMAGKVRVNGELAIKPSVQYPQDSLIEIIESPKYVSRGGEKLEPALKAFGLIHLQEMVCVDVGSSTGGFTDCLLQFGAKRVYALDVGYGLLHWKLRQDARVILMERTNARYVNQFPEGIDLVTVDASFISLKVLLPVIRGWFLDRGQVIALIKPQFEAGKADAAKGKGVIRNSEIHRAVLFDIMKASNELGYQVNGLILSPITGPKGNKEFLIHLRYPKLIEQADYHQMIESVVPLQGSFPSLKP